MDDTTRQKVEESPEERKRRDTQTAYDSGTAPQTPEKNTDSEGNPCVDLYTDTCGDRAPPFPAE